MSAWFDVEEEEPYPPLTDDDAPVSLRHKQESLPEGDGKEALRLSIQLRAQRALADGGSFIFDAPANPEPIWGSGADVAWAAGESIMLAGPPGVGKSTLAQQLVRGRMGLQDSVLGMPVKPGEGRVLYLALDRPAQIQRSMARMFADDDRVSVSDRLVVWRGPLPVPVTKEPEILATMAEMFHADSVVVDSTKDVSPKVADDEAGNQINAARQFVLTAGAEMLELHHQRKATGENKKPNKLADLYGSTWIAAGAGSVFVLWGEAGDPVVEFSHLKQPQESIGPLTLIHDHDRGVTTVEAKPDVLDAVRDLGKATVPMVARIIFATDKPSKNELAKASRKVERLVASGHLTRTEPRMGGASGTLPAFYVLADRHPRLEP